MRAFIDTDWALHYLTGHPGIVARLRALQHDLTLLTNNRRHFERIDGLDIASLP